MSCVDSPKQGFFFFSFFPHFYDIEKQVNIVFSNKNTRIYSIITKKSNKSQLFGGKRETFCCKKLLVMSDVSS
jgi:hypothetical protein